MRSRALAEARGPIPSYQSCLFRFRFNHTREEKMRLAHSLLVGIVICLLFASLAYGQSVPTDEKAHEAVVASGTQPTQKPKLSPGAEEIAHTIGVVQLIERFYDLPEHDRGVGGSVMSLEALSLRQQI